MTNRLVLVVEDEALIRLSVSEDLRDLGLEVLEAANADLALKIMESELPVLLCTDVDMPGSIDGLGLSQVVRHRWPRMKIVITSGRHNPSEGALPDGAVFLEKPVTTEELQLVVNRMLCL